MCDSGKKTFLNLYPFESRKRFFPVALGARGPVDLGTQSDRPGASMCDSEKKTFPKLIPF
jgi:hypothetical protein